MGKPGSDGEEVERPGHGGHANRRQKTRERNERRWRAPWQFAFLPPLKPPRPRLEFVLVTVKPPSCPPASWSVWGSTTLPTRQRLIGVNCIKARIVLWATAAASLFQPFAVSSAGSQSVGGKPGGAFFKELQGELVTCLPFTSITEAGQRCSPVPHAPLWKTSPLVLLPGSPPLLQDLGPLKSVVEISLLSLTLANCSKMLQM